MPSAILRQCLFAVLRETKDKFPLADLAAKALRDQQLEIGLVVDGEDFGWAH
jgi:hypothetical protein